MRPYPQAHRAVGVFAVLVVVWAAAAAAAVAPAAPPAAPSSPALDAAPQALAAELAKLGQPGPFHEYLKAYVGTWKTTTTLTVDPRLPPTVTTGHTLKRMILGGRFLKEELTGEMMGMPFNGFGITGFNNTTRKFETIWLDSMGTMIMTGSGEGENGTCTVLMDFVDPMSKQKMTAKGVTKVVDANKHVYTMYLMVGGKDMKTMEAEYIRKK